MYFDKVATKFKSTICHSIDGFTFYLIAQLKRPVYCVVCVDERQAVQPVELGNAEMKKHERSFMQTETIISTRRASISRSTETKALKLFPRAAWFRREVIQ